MQDIDWTINTPDGHKIYGITNYISGVEDRKKVVVMVHGLRAHKNVYQFKSAVPEFHARGYHVMRFDLYYDGEQGRCLTDCTLAIHARDLQEVIKQKCGEFEQVFLVGHSYGGPTVMLANPEGVQGASLWDPSFVLQGRGLPEVPGFGYLSTGSYQSILGENFCAEWNEYSLEKCLDISSQAHFPVQVIHAGKGAHAQAEKSWHSACKLDSCREVIADADHCFYASDTAQELHAMTLEWFDKCSAV